jgi:hypothetical protein
VDDEIVRELRCTKDALRVVTGRIIGTVVLPEVDPDNVGAGARSTTASSPPQLKPNQHYLMLCGGWPTRECYSAIPLAPPNRVFHRRTVKPGNATVMAA